jgi:predicted TPR repeat methyltransferase
MPDYGPETYGDQWADIYDEWVAGYAGQPDPDTVADVLAELAGDGPALELAIGTGRIALPLARRGVDVRGIDVSEHMVSRLRSKPGGDAVPVTMGNFADVPVEGRYRLIYVVFNTLFALLTQEEQVRCFESVAAHLTEDGTFLIEAFVPDVTRYQRGQNIDATSVETDQVLITASRYDSVEQVVRSAQLLIREGRVEIRPVHIRFAWPSELDLMARVAGLRLRERWGGWGGEPFTAASGSHVSIYELAGGA